MKQPFNFMTVCYLIILLIAPLSQAAEKPERPTSATSPFTGMKIAYDGNYHSQRFRWIRKYTPDDGFVADTISCGPLSMWHLKLLTRKAQCHFSVIAIDFHKNEFLGFVDIKIDGWPIARYVASMSGKATEFFENFEKVNPLGDKKTERLSRILTRLSRINIDFTQNRYVDGKLDLTVRGKLKFDPLGFGFQFTRGSWNSYPSFNFRDKTKSYDILGTSDDLGYQDIKNLDKTIATTLEILWDGYENLKQNSDEDNKDIFREHIRNNAKEIHDELHKLVVQLRKEKFQVIEMIYYLNEMSELIAAIDAILLDEVGSDPDFMTLIKEK